MRELELVRSPDDRRLYVLDGVGTLRVGRWFSRGAVAEAAGRRWELTAHGVLRPLLEARDEAGSVVGSYARRGLRRGGELAWGGRAYVLRPASRWRERYALVDGDRELAVLDGKGWGRRPVAVHVEEPSPDPGLLLFAVWIVRHLADDASSTAGATASVAAAG